MVLGLVRWVRLKPHSLTPITCTDMQVTAKHLYKQIINMLYLENSRNNHCYSYHAISLRDCSIPSLIPDTTNPRRSEIQSRLHVSGEGPWRMACKRPTMFHRAFFSLCQARRRKTSMRRLTLGTLRSSIIQWLLLQSCGECSSVTEHPSWALARKACFSTSCRLKWIVNLISN